MDILDMGAGYGRRQDPAMETGGSSEGGTTTIPGVTAMKQAQEAAILSRPDLREPFNVSIMVWSGCDLGGHFYVLCFYVLAGYGSQSGTAVYRCLRLGIILRQPFPFCYCGKLSLLVAL